MTGRDGGLQSVRAEHAAELFGPRERVEPAADEQVIPAGTVLVEQQHGLSRRPEACSDAGCLDLHQGDEAMDFGLGRHELGQDAAQPKRIFAERGSHPVITGRGRIALR